METVPNFASEQDEAEWWDAHPEVLAQRIQTAKQKGLLQRLSQTSLPGASEIATIRVPARELSRIREFAARRGLSYQTYVETLLHEALDNEEKRLAS